MHFTTLTTGAAVLLALAPTVLAVGSARVINNCGIPVYYASVAQSVHANMAALPPGGYSESYSLPNVGVSIKLSPNSTGAVTQFEFTWADGNIAYDMSNINGNPFAAGGMTLTPSAGTNSAYPTCTTVNCPAGESVCTAAYNQPDDVRTLVCGENTDLTLTLCPGGSMKRDVVVKDRVHRVHARHLPVRA